MRQTVEKGKEIQEKMEKEAGMLEEVSDPSFRQEVDMTFLFSVPGNLLSLVRTVSLSFQDSVFLPKAAAQINW